MEDLNDKITGGQLTAPQWNQIPSEIQNIIESQGLTLTDADLAQAVKAIAAYSMQGDFFVDSGTGSAYVLSVIGTKEAPESYTTGMRIRFLANTDSVGGSTTVNLNAIGTINVKTESGLDPSKGQIKSGQLTELFFDGTDAILKSNARLLLDGYKNKIIGGDFETNPWWLGTSFTSFSGGYFAPQFRCDFSSSAVIDINQTTETPTDDLDDGYFSGNSAEIEVTTADGTIGAAEFLNFEQRIEYNQITTLGFGEAGNRKMTLSFNSTHTKVGIYCVAILGSFGGTQRRYVMEYTQAVSNVKQRNVLTFPVDEVGNYQNGAGTGLIVRWSMAAGTDYQVAANTWANGSQFATANQVNALDTIGNKFKINKIQLEQGDEYTGFEVRSPIEERFLLNRYIYAPEFQLSRAISGFCDSTTVALFGINFPVEMRATPTFSIETGKTAANFEIRRTPAAATVCTALSAGGSNQGVRLTATVASGLTAGQGVLFNDGGGGPHKLIFLAPL